MLNKIKKIFKRKKNNDIEKTKNNKLVAFGEDDPLIKMVHSGMTTDEIIEVTEPNVVLVNMDEELYEHCKSNVRFEDDEIDS